MNSTRVLVLSDASLSSASVLENQFEVVILMADGESLSSISDYDLN